VVAGSGSDVELGVVHDGGNSSRRRSSRGGGGQAFPRRLGRGCPAGRRAMPKGQVDSVRIGERIEAKTRRRGGRQSRLYAHLSARLGGRQSRLYAHLSARLVAA
jgi:hypothetical protein